MKRVIAFLLAAVLILGLAGCSAKEETVDLTGKKKTTTTGGGYTPGPGGSTSVVTPPVKTGDDTPIMLWVLLAALGLFTGGLAISLKKKGRIV